MKKYFKSFNDFIPTWVICICMFLWIFGFTFIIGIVLLIKQHFQKRNIFNKMNILKENEIIKNKEIEKIKKQNENLLKCIEEMKQKESEYLKYKLENEAYTNNILKKSEYYKGEMGALQEKVDEYFITDEEINKKKEMIKELNEECKKIQENKMTKIAKSLDKKYKNMMQELNIHYKEEKEKLQNEYDSKVQELNENYEKLILYYEDKENALQDKYDSKVKELDYKKLVLYYEDKENVLQNEYDSKVQELNEDYENKKEDLQNKYDAKVQELKENYEELSLHYKMGIKNIANELEEINSNCIIKYYSFSDYDGMTSEDCKNELSILKQKEKELRRNSEDIELSRYYRFEKRMEQNIIRKMLRTFNAECDNICFNITAKNIDKGRKKIENSFETLNKLYSDNGVSLTTALLELKLEQITTIYTYELKKQQEKEIQKAIKEQMVEEAKAQKEIEDAKKKVEKDLQQHLGEINRMMKYMQKTKIDAEKQLYIDKIKELEEKIKMLEADKEAITEREANAKAGFVYIISNIGSFGENIYKIGMTRRLEPMDRIKELSSASVPFEFDVHAMIFSSDAPELENTLHKHFADYAVNKVNPRKEFYNVDIDKIEKVVKENYNDTVQFTKIPIASEYRQSINLS